MNCSECLTANDIFDGVRVVDAGCVKKVDRFNRILRNFYLDTVNIPYNLVAQPISNGLITIDTEFPIYKIFGFFGKGCDSKYIDQHNKCCGDGIDFLKMYQVDWDPEVCQYKRICDTKVKANIPTTNKDGYFVYSRGPIKIQSLNESICMDLTMLTGLEYYIEHFYGESEREANVMSKSQSNYDRRLEDIKNSSKAVTFNVTMGQKVNAPFYK